MKEKVGFSLNGYLSILMMLAATVFVVFLLSSVQIPFDLTDLSKIIISVLILSLWAGFFMVQPNQAKVMTLFGAYVGSVKKVGLRWTIPIFVRKKISLRIRNFESGKIKVNDNQGNPIEIATIVVWAVTDSAEAVFQVDDYESFVSIQSESALRNLATSYPYDPQSDDEVALRSDPVKIAEKLKDEIQERLALAGVTVQEARISHLAYAPEIASAMLQRQQATAVIAARTKIVEGAVGMVELALERLKEQNVVDLDEERKAVMVSNLLVVLCGDKSTQPILNAGTLY